MFWAIEPQEEGAGAGHSPESPDLTRQPFMSNSLHLGLTASLGPQQLSHVTVGKLMGCGSCCLSLPLLDPLETPLGHSQVPPPCAPFHPGISLPSDLPPRPHFTENNIRCPLNFLEFLPVLFFFNLHPDLSPALANKRITLCLQESLSFGI